MYIISNYLSIIKVIGIIDNLAADYPTQFFLMYMGMLPIMTHTNYSRVPCPAKKQPS